MDTAGILNTIKANIYYSLIYYWNIPNDSGFLATFLDPRYKNLDCVEIEDENPALYKNFIMNMNQ